MVKRAIKQTPMKRTFLSVATTLEPASAELRNRLPAATLAAVEELLIEGRAKNTVRTYQSALSYVAAWHVERFEQLLPLLLEPSQPLLVPTVMQFIVDHVDRTTDGGLKHELPASVQAALIESGVKRSHSTPALSTTLLRLAVIAKAHSLRALVNPVDNSRVRELVKRVKRAYAARGERARPKKALPRAPLEAMLSTCDDSLVGRRDRALLLFAWASGGRRRSEIAAATLDQLERISETQFIYHLRHSKTNQEATDDGRSAKPIVGSAALAMNEWLVAAKISDGRLFRSLRNGRIGQSLTSHSVALIVKARAARAGLDGDYSGHSLRSGFITEAGRQAKPLADVMHLSGHRSVPQALSYYQPGNVLNSTVADLLATSND